MRKYYIFIGGLGILVLVFTSLSFIIGGSPAAARDKAFDQTRLNHFNSLKYAIDQYYKNEQKLPAKLSDLPTRLIKIDPQTNTEYTYTIQLPPSYKLCTTFSTDSSNSSNDEYIPLTSQNKHKKGYDCITYSVSQYVVKNVTPTPYGYVPYSLTPYPAPICEGDVINRTCFTTNCSYPYPLDIYKRSGITYRPTSDAQDRSIADQCDPSKSRVVKYYCRNSASTNATYETKIYECPKGCFDGACIQTGEKPLPTNIVQ